MRMNIFKILVEDRLSKRFSIAGGIFNINNHKILDKVNLIRRMQKCHNPSKALRKLNKIKIGRNRTNF